MCPRPACQRSQQQYLMRSELNSVGASFNVVKNSLLSLGFERAGLAPLKPLLRGKVAVASGDANVAVAQKLLSLSRKVRPRAPRCRPLWARWAAHPGFVGCLCLRNSDSHTRALPASGARLHCSGRHARPAVAVAIRRGDAHSRSCRPQLAMHPSALCQSFCCRAILFSGSPEALLGLGGREVISVFGQSRRGFSSGRGGGGFAKRGFELSVSSGASLSRFYLSIIGAGPPPAGGPTLPPPPPPPLRWSVSPSSLPPRLCIVT
jgi:hypothetical protein